VTLSGGWEPGRDVGWVSGVPGWVWQSPGSMRVSVTATRLDGQRLATQPGRRDAQGLI
jgi:hypothetical protein